jgi:hypothetical protein
MSRSSLKYLREVKAWGILLTAGAVLVALAVPAGASARGGVHGRHVEYRRPTVGARVQLGTHGGYRMAIEFEEPDQAVLIVGNLDLSRLAGWSTRYGAHFRGSLSGGRVSADFGPVGSIAVRFRPDGAARTGRPVRGCEGKRPRTESGRWVGKISLRGEGGYFAVRTGSSAGTVDRTFRLRCHVRRPRAGQRHESLRERVEPGIGGSILSFLLGTVSSLQAVEREDGRVVELRAAHASGRGPGAEVEAGAFEYQGRTPVGRIVQILDAPAGSLLTSLPGERPASATLKPGAPFSGEASYLAVSPTVHDWTGTLAVRFPGLAVPLAGPRFFSTLCVVSPLVKPRGCEFQPPNLQGGGEAPATGGES